MDLSLLDEQILAMDDSFLVSKPEAMDDEVSQILKKWNKTSNSLHSTPKKVLEYANAINQNDSFDSRTYTRPKKRNDQTMSIITTVAESEGSLESGIASINFQCVPLSSLSEVSPPSSICTSMDFQNCDNMLNSLITSSDFSNVSFLLNGHDGSEMMHRMNNTVSIENVSPTKSLTRNLMDFTFDVNKTNPLPSNSTYTNVDHQLNDPAEDSRKNLTFNARQNDGNFTWDKIQEHQNQLNLTIVQSTPVHTLDDGVLRKSFDHTMSPISCFQAEPQEEDDAEVVIRSVTTRKLIDNITFDDYRNSLEDQCEFLLNEETIKLSSRVLGDTFECDDLKSALIQSADANEKDFDKMLDTFNVKKSLESEKLLQSVDNIKQRHSLINLEKQREEKQKKDEEYDNKTQYDAMNKSSERLLRRSRLYDDVNLLLQKQQIETITNKSAKSNELEQLSDTESDHVVDKSNRDRFKTIKLNKKLQSGMVVVNDELEQTPVENDSSTSPGTNKERRNQLNQQKQENDDVEFKKPAAASKMSNFGFSRPSYRSRNDLNLPLKASSTDSLDNDEPRMHNIGSTMKSPMGIKSKSIHNLMFGGNSSSQNGLQRGSHQNLKLVPGAARSQSNLKGPRTSSLVRPSYCDGYKVPVSNQFGNQQSNQMRAPTSRKTSLVRPSSGYYGNTYTSKRMDSDNESGCSLSSSSASSRNSVHLSNVAVDQQNLPHHQDEPIRVNQKATGAIPKPSGLRPPSNLRAPQARSGLLPRPSAVVRR